MYKLVDNRQKTCEPLSAFEKITNSQIYSETPKSPKITFDARQTYEEAVRISQTKAIWENDHENPIYRFFPERRKQRAQSAVGRGPAEKEARPGTAKKEANAFLTTFKVEDCKDIKFRLCKEDPVVDMYSDPAGLRFRTAQPDVDKPIFKVLFFDGITKLA